MAAISLAATDASGENVTSDAFDAQGYVADLNVVAENWVEGELTNSDVVIIASAGCSMLRKLEADSLMVHAASWIEAQGYPEPSIVEKTEMQDFVAFEVKAFEEAGASNAALDLLERTIWERANLQVEAPSFEIDWSTTHEQFCGARLLSGADPDAPASEAQVVLVGSVVDSTVGASMIAVDAVIGIGSGGADAGFIAILSGGVGYDLLKRGMGG